MFDLIHADPPWRYDDANENRGGASRHYQTMSLEDMKRMNVSDFANDPCVLFMWTTGPQLDDSMELMRAWGFDYRTMGFVWVKRTPKHWENVAERIRKFIRSAFAARLGVSPRIVGKAQVPVSEVMELITPELMKEAGKDFWHWGQGHYTRSNAEIVLVGVRTKKRGLPRMDKGIHQVLEDIFQGHSVKPDEVYRRLEALYGDARRLDMFTRRNQPGWSALGDQVDRTDFYIDPITFQIMASAPAVAVENAA